MSKCGPATQDTATTPSSLSSPSTPRDSEYPNADFSSKDGQQLPSLTELDSTIPGQVQVLSPDCSELAEATDHGQIQQGIDMAIVDEMRPSHYNTLRQVIDKSPPPTRPTRPNPLYVPRTTKGRILSLILFGHRPY